MDIVCPQVRSRMMASVRQLHTKPELLVRRVIHALGFRFRLHRRDLPGSPDIVLLRLRKAVFVHGCFWHRHGCRKTTTPASNVEFWKQKFEANQRRDRSALLALHRLGWHALVVWECETLRAELLERRLRRFLNVSPLPKSQTPPQQRRCVP
jgi:DNA mismatch endonuclease (patch repair protein)